MKKICVVTGSRAEYGIMRSLLKKLDAQANIQLEVIATAMHLEEKYGYTYKVIEADGFKLIKVPLDLKDTSKETIVKSMSLLTGRLGDIFSRNSYDLIIILGDRYEMLPVANVALIYNIPVCHIHGGEKTLGNFDESIRHAITKMSHLHLVASDEFRKRVLQLGEQEEKVHTIGALGVENVLAQTFLTRAELEQTLQIALEKDYYVVLFHPVTLEDGHVEEQVQQLLKALDKVKQQCIFIGSNSDTGSDSIHDLIREYLHQHPNCHQFTSLTTQGYHSLIKHSKGLIGNSSSGLIEVPSLKVATLNIGNRQLGRLRGKSVIDVRPNMEDILIGLEQMKAVEDYSNPYEQDHSSDKAVAIILDYLEKNNGQVVKIFSDM